MQSFHSPRHSPRHSPWLARAHLLGSFLVACLPLGAAGCGDNRPPVAAEKPWRLSAEINAVSVKAGGVFALRFTLISKSGSKAGPMTSSASSGTRSAAVVGERVEFSAIREMDIAGATLSGASALTDGQGVATVNLTAGRPTKFEISAQNSRAEPSRVLVTVFESQLATLSVLVELDDGFSPPRPIARTELSILPDQLCATFSPVNPPFPPGGFTMPALGTPTDVRIDRMHQNALLARGFDTGGTLQAVGCVDVTNSAVLPSVTARVSLTMSAVPLVPGPTYNLSAHFSLAKRNIAARIAGPWRDLTDCPLDPAQIWLDCTIDSLGASAAQLPIDCVPPTSTGDSSALADTIQARRGTFAAAAGTSCRTATLANGEASLDARLAALFPSPALSPAKNLDALATLAAQILDDFVVTSTLRLDPTGSPGVYHGTHSLHEVVFSIGPTVIPTDVLRLGIPTSEARFIDVSATGSTLAVGEHRLAIRMGTLSELAFERAAAARLGIAPGIPAILDALFQLAAAEPESDRARVAGCLTSSA